MPVNTDKKISNPFASLMYCGKCGKAMRSNHARGKKRVYCSTFGCTTVSSLLSNVEGKFFEGIHEMISDVSVELSPIENNILDILNSRIEKIDKDIDEVNSMIEEAFVLLEKKYYTPEIFLERSKINNDKLEKLKSTKNDILKQIEEENQRIDKMVNIKPKILSMLEIYNDAEPEQRNKILRSFITKIVYNREKKDSLTFDFSLDIYFD